MDTDPVSSADPPQRREQMREASPQALSVAVIIWTDDTMLEPTVIADRRPVFVARAAALAIHEVITDPDAFAGASDFLETQKPPHDWRAPEDVDSWLDALREATPYPAFGFHHVPITGGEEGLDDLAVDRHLQRALQERERALLPDDPGDLSGGGEPRRSGVER